jgi:hypothetical protein
MIDIAKLQDIAANSTILDGKLAAQKILDIRDRLKDNTLTTEKAKEELIAVAIVHTKAIIHEESSSNKAFFVTILDVKNSSGKGNPALSTINELALI